MGAKEVMSTAGFKMRKRVVDAAGLGQDVVKELHVKWYSEPHYISSREVAEWEIYMWIYVDE
jgi:hypothetical protein